MKFKKPKTSKLSKSESPQKTFGKGRIANLGHYAFAEKKSFGERNTAHLNPFKSSKQRKDY
jgi:hypothetical protein